MPRNIIYLLLLLLPACNQHSNRQQVRDQELADFGLKEPDGTLLDPDQYIGKTVFLNCWATWCNPCLEEMPSIQQAMRRLENRDIVFLFASDEDTTDIEQFKRQSGYSFHFVQIKDLSAAGITALPATYIFNPEGRLVHRETGARKWDDPEGLALITNAKKSR